MLPVLFVAIIANTVILALVVVAARNGRRDRVGESATRSALQGSLLSTSFVDSSGPSAWGSEAASRAGADGGRWVRWGRGRRPRTRLATRNLLARWRSTAVEAADEDGAGAAERRRRPSWTPTAGVDAVTGLIGPGAFTRLVAAEDVRMQRYHRPATVVIFELGGLDRLIDRLGTDAADRIVPALADTMTPARPRRRSCRRGSPRAGSACCCPRPTRSRRSTTSSGSGAPASCGWSRARSRSAWRSAGRARPATRSLIEAQRLATDRMYAELRREARKAVEL